MLTRCELLYHVSDTLDRVNLLARRTRLFSLTGRKPYRKELFVRSLYLYADNLHCLSLDPIPGDVLSTDSKVCKNELIKILRDWADALDCQMWPGCKTKAECLEYDTQEFYRVYDYYSGKINALAWRIDEIFRMCLEEE